MNSSALRANVGIGLGLCTLLGLWFALLNSTRDLMEANQVAVHARRAVDTLNGLDTILTRGELDDARNLLHHRPLNGRRAQYLRLYLHEQTGEFAKLVLDEPSQHSRTDELQKLVMGRLCNVGRGQYTFPPAPEQKARGLIDGIRDEENQILARRIQAVEGAERLTWALEITGGVLAVTLIGAGALLLKREMAGRIQAEQKLSHYGGYLERTKTKLETVAATDALTKVANRRGFDSRLDEELKAGSEKFEALSLLLLDVDKFKSYNDTYGHLAGDRILAEVGKILQSQIREGDFVARYGGEEFGVIMPGANGADALQVAERIREAVESHTWPDRAITVSIGAATSKRCLESAAALIASADAALYRAKESGRNRAIHNDSLSFAA